MLCQDSEDFLKSRVRKHAREHHLCSPIVDHQTGKANEHDMRINGNWGSEAYERLKVFVPVASRALMLVGH